MNKKLNSFFFIIGATVFNVVAMLMILFLLMFLAGLVMPENAAPGVKMASFAVIALLAVLVSYKLYSRVVSWMDDRWHLKHYLAGAEKIRRD